MARYYEGEALIAFVKQYTPQINGETTMECVERAIREAPTADVAPKSEVAREIFEEIERMLDLNTFQGDIFTGKYFDVELATDIAELKKKYTEENK